MIRGLFARTGGGKTLLLVREIIKVLLETERMVVTNLQELNLDRLNEYLQECRQAEALKHPSRARPPVDLNRRLLVIPKNQTRYFYRYRSGGLVLPIVEDKGKDGKFIGIDAFEKLMETYFDPCYSKKEYAIGVEYFMSECHRHFPARLYQEFGHAMGFYATQHRHLDDNVWIESQFPKQIDMNFRELAVEWYHVRNHGREVMGMFRQRAVFSWRLFYELPTGKLPPADDKGEFKLDAAGIASCYKTRGAISALAPSGAEEQPKSKKLPFWVLPVALIVGVVLIGVGVAFLPSLTGKILGRTLGSLTRSTQSTLSSSVSPPSAAGAASKPVDEPRSSPVAEPKEQKKEPVFVTGVAWRNGVCFVQFSDGTRRWRDLSRSKDGDGISYISPSAVTVDGQKFYITPRARESLFSHAYEAQKSTSAAVTAAQVQSPVPDTQLPRRVLEQGSK